jgi:hypothetical protein
VKLACPSLYNGRNWSSHVEIKDAKQALMMAESQDKKAWKFVIG